MRTENISDLNKNISCVLALGFFDCVHIGHKKVIQSAVETARSLSVKSAVFTFRNNIFELFGSNKKPLFSFDERVKEIEKLGVDYLFYLDADAAFLSLSPESFISFLKARLDVRGVVCGEDFTFGQNGQGGAKTLVKAFPYGENSVIPLLSDGREKIGTGQIKKMLQEGKPDKAARFLGRNYAVSGIVSTGRKDGSKIGYPTINLNGLSSPLKFGVYFTDTILDGKRYASVTNVGPHPTFGDFKENIETHLLSYNGNAYGKEVTIEFLAFDRELIRFDSVETLMKTIENDVEKRRNYD